MQHEALVELAGDVLDLLFVVGGAERAGDQRLGFAAREHDRPVDARQHAGLGPDRADLVELAAVEPHALLERLHLHHVLLQLVEDVVGVLLRLRVGALAQRGHHVGLHLVHLRVALELRLDAHRVGERAGDLAFDRGAEIRRDLVGLDGQLGLADGRLELVDGGDDLLDRGVRRFERADDLGFRHLLGAGFHHHDAVLGAGDDQVEQALLALGEGRVDDELVVDQADAHAGDRLLERNLRDGERGRGAGDGEHVGVVVGVGRHDHRR